MSQRECHFQKQIGTFACLLQSALLNISNGIFHLVVFEDTE